MVEVKYFKYPPTPGPSPDKVLDYSRWTFPGGEVGVKITNPETVDPEAEYVITAKVPNSEDVFVILNLVDALRRLGVPRRHIQLGLPYMPYARQDRVCHPGESLALEVFAKVLATCEAAETITADMHSKAGVDILDKHVYVFNHPQGTFSSNLPKFQFFVAPDAGAHEKARLASKALGVPLVCLSKVRQHGRVVYEDLEEGTLYGTVCVVDDLIDGGATFLSLAEMLRRTQPGITRLSLYVTHGLFSKGVDILRPLYDEVFVSYMYNEADKGKVTLVHNVTEDDHIRHEKALQPTPEQY